MSIIDTLINFIKPKKHISGDILTVETNNGEILNSFICPADSNNKNNVYMMFYNEYHNDIDKLHTLNGCYVYKYSDINYLSKKDLEEMIKNVKPSMAMYAPEAVYVTEKSFNAAQSRLYQNDQDVYNHVKQELEQYSPDMLTYAYDNYAKFIEKHGYHDIPRSEDFFIKAIEHGTNIENIPEKSRSPHVTEVYSMHVLKQGQQKAQINYEQKDWIAIMKDFMAIRFEKDYDYDMSIYGIPGRFEYYKNHGVKNPLKIYPDMNLSVQDWHYLCSISTELISNGYVPKEVLDNPSFWENYTDLIGKGDFLDNPDKTRYQTFDESEVFVHMPESMKKDPEVQKILLAQGTISTNFFGKKMSPDTWKCASPEEYMNIPVEIRQQPDFREIGIKAVRAYINNLRYIPSGYIENWMVEKAIKHDMSLLYHIPDEVITSIPNIEQKLLDGINNYRQQDIFYAEDLPGEYGLVACEQKEAMNMLRYIPQELRTKNICQVAVRISQENEKYVPNSLRIKTEDNEKNRSVQTKEGGTDKQAHTLKFPKDSENMDTGGNSKFFIRYIDTITLDTMYFVCRIDIHGDTIPDQIEVRYANDSICSYQYYLNNNGDTVLLDYSRQQDQIAQQDTLVWENDSLFNEVQDSILNADEQRLIEDVTEYLDRIAQKGLEKERTIDSLRRENRESKELRELLRDPEIPDLP